jgi:hypothetical protein
MMDGLGEEDRAVWFEFGQKLRQAHDRCLGERPRLVSNRDGYVLPHAMLFRSANAIETVSYPIDHRAQIMECLVRWGREHEGLAIATIFQGVSPEQEGGKVHLRPTILSLLLGLGRYERWVLEVNQRIDRKGSQSILRMPLVRRRGPNTSAMEWEAELGSGDILRGPWPKRVPVWEE